MAGMDVETFSWPRHIYLGRFSHLYNFSTVLYLSQEESHLDNYNLDPPTTQSRVLAPYMVDVSLSLISIGDSHSIQAALHFQFLYISYMHISKSSISCNCFL